MAVSRYVLLRMRNISDKICRVNEKAHFMFNNIFFFEIRAVYVIMLKKYGRAAQATVDSTIRRMRISCWLTKATNTHSGYAILIAFPQQQWLHDRASMLRHTYIASLVPIYVSVQII
jgi:hypothetical protein